MILCCEHWIRGSSGGGKKEDNLPDIVVPTKITLQMQNPNMKGH